jgi:hypothetical protein
MVHHDEYAMIKHQKRDNLASYPRGLRSDLEYATPNLPEPESKKGRDLDDPSRLTGDRAELKTLSEA